MYHNIIANICLQSSKFWEHFGWLTTLQENCLLLKDIFGRNTSVLVVFRDSFSILIVNENTSLLAWKFCGRIYPCSILLLMSDGASCPSESFALAKWMSACYISIMFVGTNTNTLGEIWPKFLQTISFLMNVWSPWAYLSEQFPLVISSSAECGLEFFIVDQEKWLFIQCLSFNIALGTTCLWSPPPLVPYCQGVYGVLAVVICFTLLAGRVAFPLVITKETHWKAICTYHLLCYGPTS